MPDFHTVAKKLKNHFCPNCDRSFECDNEKGDCSCPGREYGWRKPWCDDCTEAQAKIDQQEIDEYNEDCDDD